MSIPKFDQLFTPALQALHNLGGSASIEELVDEVARLLGLSDIELAETTRDGSQARFAYRLAWARSYLKAFGLLQNSERGIWSLTSKGKDTRAVDVWALWKELKGMPKHWIVNPIGGTLA